METLVLLAGLYLLTRGPSGTAQVTRVLSPNEQYLNTLLAGRVVTPASLAVTSRISGPRVEGRSSGTRSSAPGPTVDVEGLRRTVNAGVDLVKTVDDVRRELDKSGWGSGYYKE